MNQGETWQKISPDLTKGKKDGNVAFGTLTTISESKINFGLLYIGTDDGNVQISKDGGNSWQTISENLPQNLWISRVVASKFKKERVFVTLNGYRNDDFNSYIFVSDDYGSNWKNIASSQKSAANVLIEDTENENILFLGTDNGLQISIDRGATWNDFSNGMPKVAVHDLVIQYIAKELIVGTHGRSLYKVDLSKIQLFNQELLKKQMHLFAIENVNKQDFWGSKNSFWSEDLEPKFKIWYYLKELLNVKFHNVIDLS